jgi:putative ABC transport system permease protein
MKNVLLLAWHYLRFNKIKTLILIFSIAVAIFLPLAINLLVRDYQDDLFSRARDTPLIAGAQGSRLDLVLNGLYFRGKPAQDLTMGEVDGLNSSGLALSVPVLIKHTARGFPIVGTSLEYFEIRHLQIASGSGLTRLGDCVLGAAVAKKLKLQSGAMLMSDAENVFDLAGSYPLNMRVKGLLAPTSTADDNAIFVDLKTEWLILGLMHGHQEAATADPTLLISRDASNVTASAALLPFQEVTTSNISLFHMHGDPAANPISAILAWPLDEKSSAILRGRYQTVKSAVQLLVPRTVVRETFDLVFRVKRFFDAQAVLVGAAMALLLGLVVLLSLRLRQSEMETMFKIGCARVTVFSLMATEIVMVLAIGVGVAVVSSWLVVETLGLSGSRVKAARLVPAQRTTRATPRVAVVNYPLKYFTKRIAGERGEIFFPVPSDQDPAFWQPQDKEIREYQQSDVILLNGADYEKWVPTAVLPLLKQVITSQSFSDRYMKNGEVVTHSHGPQGSHSHGAIDFNTWMDPAQASLQAQSIYDQLVRLCPGAKKELDANLKALQTDLSGLDTSLAWASTNLGSTPLLASHPVYQYAARRYGWNLKSMHWEPDEMPSEEEWRKFESLHEQFPAKIMIWEKDPLPLVAQKLRAMGIEPVTFETCANEPGQGDYLAAMNANATRLAAAAAKFR